MHNRKMGIATILILLNFIAFSACVMDPETDPDLGIIIAVGDGSASPGAKNVSINVTMDNADPVKGIQMDICDDGDHLTCIGCETSVRTSDFYCQSNELSDGCARIIIISLGGDSIDAGTGPLLSLKYDVADDTPPAECFNLTPVGTLVSDENRNSVDATTEAGEFCIN